MMTGALGGVAGGLLRETLAERAEDWPDETFAARRRISAAGAFYGAGLYAINIVGIAPLIGLTRGEGREPTGVVAHRLAMHVLFGIVTTTATEALRHRSRSKGSP